MPDTLTPPSLPQSYLDDAAGLRYITRLGPDLPGLNAAGLEWVRLDCVRYAAADEEQARDAAEAGNWTLNASASASARALRTVAAQITTYALGGWGVEEPTP